MKRLLFLWLAVVALLAGCASSSAPTVSDNPSVAAKSPSAVSVQEGVSGLPTVPLSELPPEAIATYDLIMDGGPFPYRQDDQVFGNREGLLPDEEYGWYREYTIPTPGSPDRGAQRFVVSEDDVFFYTDDHYDSFSEVIP